MLHRLVTLFRRGLGWIAIRFFTSPEKLAMLIELRIITAINLHLRVIIGIKLQLDYGSLLGYTKASIREAKESVRTLRKNVQVVLKPFPTARKFALERMPEIYAEQVALAALRYPDPRVPYPATCPYTIEELLDEED